MIVIAYGYKLPELDDDGSVFFPAIEFDITRLASHQHDGVTGALLLASQQNILAASWAAVAGLPGLYSQVVTMPGSLQYDSTDISFRLADGSFVYPTVTKTSANTYTIYTNDNTLSYVAVYSS